jgi:hypothetical protein
MNSPSPVPAAPTNYTSFRVRWSRVQAHPLRGLALARERGWLLTWDDHDWLYIFSRDGEPQGQVHLRRPLALACGADDGSAIVAVGRHGEIWWLTPDLRTRWEQALALQPLAVALDPYGQYLAVADAGGGLQSLDCHGRSVFRTECPRALHHLAFVPEAPFLLGGSDFGLVACFNPAGELVWRDGLVAHIGALTVSGDGSQIVVACFTDGLQRYSLQGKRQGRLTGEEPFRLAALSYDGKCILTAGLSNRLQLVQADGSRRATHDLDKAVLAIALSPLADCVVAALVDGELVALEIS